MWMNVVYMLACLSDAPMPTKSLNQHGNLCSRQHQNKGNIITSIDGRERWRGDQMEGWMLWFPELYWPCHYLASNYETNLGTIQSILLKYTTREFFCKWHVTDIKGKLDTIWVCSWRKLNLLILYNDGQMDGLLSPGITTYLCHGVSYHTHICYGIWHCLFYNAVMTTTNNNLSWQITDGPSILEILMLMMMLLPFVLFVLHSIFLVPCHIILLIIQPWPREITTCHCMREVSHCVTL